MNATFVNLAGVEDCDETVKAELETAGILVREFSKPFDGEVPTRVMGTLYGWLFKRAWHYWVAIGPGIPPEPAEKLHSAHGQEVRVDGHCGCPSPREWFGGFAVGCYHVDTLRGLKALADTIREIGQSGPITENGTRKASDK